MAVEDFTTYTEVDPNNHIALVGTNHIDSTVTRNETAYIYKDKGVDHFGNFTHKVNLRGQDIDDDAIQMGWMLSNDLDDWQGLYTGSKTTIALAFIKIKAGDDRTFKLYETYGGVAYSDTSIQITVGAWYYLLIKKTGTSLLCGIYSTAFLRDAGDGTDGDVDNLTVTLQADHKFRYVFGCCSRNTGNALQSDGDIEDLDLQEAVGGLSIPVAIHHYRNLRET